MPKLNFGGSYLTLKSNFFCGKKELSFLKMIKILTFGSLLTQFRGFLVIVFFQMGIFIQN